jgi:hypothetical protein
MDEQITRAIVFTAALALLGWLAWLLFGRRK